MKPLPFYFVVFQMLDYITTYIGASLDIPEGNPFYSGWATLIAKAVSIICIAIILQILWNRKLLWILPSLSAIIVAWNSFWILLILLMV
jgi:hypothetical protein